MHPLLSGYTIAGRIAAVDQPWSLRTRKEFRTEPCGSTTPRAHWRTNHEEISRSEIHWQDTMASDKIAPTEVTDRELALKQFLPGARLTL
jgi:hypothetical protein